MVSVLIDHHQWNELKTQARAQTIQVTLPCGAPAVMKTSSLGTAFFAHAPGRSDGCAPEGREHLLVKAAVIRAAAAAGWSATPEFAQDRWRADVMLERDRRRVAVEVQWSSQTPQLYAQRTQAYRDSDVPVVWLARLAARDRRGWSPWWRDLPIVPMTVDVAAAAIALHPVWTDDYPLERGATDNGPRSPEATIEDLIEVLTAGMIWRAHPTDRERDQSLTTVHPVRCYQCDQWLAVWVSGRRRRRWCACGPHDVDELDQAPLWNSSRPEASPHVQSVARAAIARRRWSAALIQQRSSRTAGTTYQAFVCPHCYALLGDFHLAQEIDQDAPAMTLVTGTVPDDQAPLPHWCHPTNAARGPESFPVGQAAT